MTYTFKLSRRIALLRDPLGAVALTLAAACGTDAMTDPAAPAAEIVSTPEAVRLSPRQITVETNQKVAFRATLRTADGREHRRVLHWESDGGSIAADGTFRASKPGSYRIFEKHGSRHTPGDTSIVVVVPPAPALSEVIVSPSSVDLAQGASQDFSATGRLADGSSTAVGVIWSASGGTIDQVGHFVAGKTPGRFAVVALNQSSGKTDSASVTVSAPTLESLAVTPATVSTLPGASVQFVAQGRLSDGSISEVPVTFRVSGGSITAAGLYTAGNVSGAFQVIAAATNGAADTAVVSIGAAASATAASGLCLARPGVLMTLSGVKTARYDSRPAPLSSDTKVNASSASWTAVGAFAVDIAAQPGACWFGGAVLGTYDQTSTPWSTYHGTAASYVMATDFVLEGLRADNYGDGVRFTPAETRNWTLRGAHFSDMHDDCVENDRLSSGKIEDSFFDGCYVAFSARPSLDWASTVNGSGNTMTVEGSLIRLKPMATVYKGPTPGHGGFFKWSDAAPKLSLHDNVFRVDQLPNHGSLGIPTGKLASCSNNVVVWLGAGDYPATLPSCFTITRDKGVWDRAVAAWQARHP